MEMFHVEHTDLGRSHFGQNRYNAMSIMPGQGKFMVGLHLKSLRVRLIALVGSVQQHVSIKV